MVDVLVVGWFCETPVLTGVNSGSQITHLVAMAVSGLSVGGTVLVAQYFAARKPKDVSETIGTMFTLLLICAAALTTLVLIFARPLLKLMQLDGVALDAGEDYLRICTYGTVFIFGYNAISAVQRGMGDSKHPLWFVGVACVVNIILDYALVGPLEDGRGGRGVGDDHRAGGQPDSGGVVSEEEGLRVRFQIEELRADQKQGEAPVPAGSAVVGAVGGYEPFVHPDDLAGQRPERGGGRGGRHRGQVQFRGHPAGGAMASSSAPLPRRTSPRSAPIARCA